MKNKHMFRRVFQTFTFILFIIQFQQSIKKYFQYPVIEQKSRLPVKDLPNPVVYVCNENGFNYQKANDYGYKYFSRFLAGILTNSTTISWKGKWGNITFNDPKNILLDSKYSSLESETLVISTTDLWNVNEWKRTFLFPHGVCVELANVPHNTTVKILSRDEINIYFVDPNRANKQKKLLMQRLSLDQHQTICFLGELMK